uniref:Uncharacterized protein n=1 Tax=Acrobeloides nanus TaxID=290746 RepID=A0A914EJF9_9BILA
MASYKDRINQLEHLIFDELNSTTFSDFLFEASKHLVVNKVVNAIDEQEANKRELYNVFVEINEEREKIADLKQKLVNAFASYEEKLKAELEVVRTVKARQNEFTEKITSGIYQESKQADPILDITTTFESTNLHNSTPSRIGLTSTRFNPFTPSRFRTTLRTVEFSSAPKNSTLDKTENMSNNQDKKEEKIPPRRSLSSPSLKYTINKLPPTPISLKKSSSTLTITTDFRQIRAGSSNANYDDSVIMSVRQSIPSYSGWKSPFRPTPINFDMSYANASELSSSNNGTPSFYKYGANKENQLRQNDTTPFNATNSKIYLPNNAMNFKNN